MTPEQVRKGIEYIAEMAHDPELAHSEEDSLHASVLQAIADGADDPRELAALALTTEDLEFPRWCA